MKNVTGGADPALAATGSQLPAAFQHTATLVRQFVEEYHEKNNKVR